ncbi:hypothetical protein [Dyadobacter bucti]|uniref:hypothetical protein n=1 Tax=Dyadobacter bucti TaxID=2572203 RepID=UPI0014077C33|nr:hypothetical protein [Dyadobacter bucti]
MPGAKENDETPRGNDKLFGVENQLDEDILILEIIKECEKGDTITYEQFKKEMGWNQ